MTFIGEQQMKPKNKSRHLLSITQAKAKMFEYDVPTEDHITIERDPANLFPLSIGILGDVASEINNGIDITERKQEIKEILPFSARFFDSYMQARLNSEIDPYLLIVGSAAYYLCDMPGSSQLLAKGLNSQHLDLEGFGLDTFLIWLLRGNFSKSVDIGNSPFRDSLSPIIQQFEYYVANGRGEHELKKQLHKFRTSIYQQGTPRQLLFVDLVGALIHKRLANSTWATLPGYSNLSKERWENAIKKDTFIRELWPAQHRMGKQGVYRGKSAIIQMPTSAGKTKAIEIILRSAFIAERIKMAVIVAPFRALCHEIKNNLIKAFRGEKIFVNELSDTLQIDFSAERLLQENQVIVVTPEKLNYILRHSSILAENVGLLIFDEGHQFDNGTRGITYELLLTSLKARIPRQAQIILISAVISNANQIGEWLLGENFEIVSGSDLLPTHCSVAFFSWPDVQYGRLEFVNPSDIDTIEFFVPRVIQQYNLGTIGRERKDRIFPQKSVAKEIALYFGLKLIKKGSVAIFCGQKATVTGICFIAIDIYDRGFPIKTPQQISGNKQEIYKLWQLYKYNLGEDALVTKCGKVGIFSHHNNIPHGIRLAVEYAIKEGQASFVICTSTLAQGVNLPIRYLVVTSVQQGRDKIKVRDFQNLIGRSGRSDKHTEGSIIFPDPVLFDQRKQRGEWRWNNTRELLNPSNSEPCTSSLYSLFEKLKSDDEKYIIDIDPFELIEYYNQDYTSLITRLENAAEDHEDKKFSVSGLLNQVAYKAHLISAIESYLMANWDESHPEFDEDAVSTLARGTLAYFLATKNKDEKQQKHIVKLFNLLAHNIAERVPDIQKRIIFGRTLFGLRDAVAISEWLTDNVDKLITIEESIDILNLIWPLFSNYIYTRPFRKCNKPELLARIATLWLMDAPYSEMFQYLVEADAKIKSGSRNYSYKIEDIVDICENGFAYDGMLLVGAVIEFLQSMPIEGTNNLIELMTNFQKQIKYGLSSQTAIILYEIGFSDRIIAEDMSTLFDDVQPDKELLIQALKGRKDQVFEKLKQYPSYFSDVYRIVAT
jgi:POLQ-like helicase